MSDDVTFLTVVDNRLWVDEGVPYSHTAEASLMVEYLWKHLPLDVVKEIEVLIDAKNFSAVATLLAEYDMDMVVEA